MYTLRPKQSICLSLDVLPSYFLPSSRVTNLSWLIQGFPTFCTESNVPGTPFHSQVYWPHWPPYPHPSWQGTPAPHPPWALAEIFPRSSVPCLWAPSTKTFLLSLNSCHVDVECPPKNGWEPVDQVWNAQALLDIVILTVTLHGGQPLSWFSLQLAPWPQWPVLPCWRPQPAQDSPPKIPRGQDGHDTPEHLCSQPQLSALMPTCTSEATAVLSQAPLSIFPMGLQTQPCLISQEQQGPFLPLAALSTTPWVQGELGPSHGLITILGNYQDQKVMTQLC